ncbi:hypothetical protein [Streptomyces sp. Y1]|uniref:Uncharacterized protein n=1 Tax=Streptomyces sp. Y1 TaxID=3238634 RepID=A0AB39TVQ7_9ACTN
MSHPKHRFCKRLRIRFDVLATWSESPQGRLVRWAVGAVLAIVSLGLTAYGVAAGHPLKG